MALTIKEHIKQREESISHVKRIEFGERVFKKGMDFDKCAIYPMDDRTPFWTFEFHLKGEIETYCTTMPFVIVKDGPFEDEE